MAFNIARLGVDIQTGAPLIQRTNTFAYQGDPEGTRDIFYHFGCTSFGLWLNELLLDTFCFEPFLKCLARHSGDTNKRADMVVSVHPLTQDIPLKILSFLDSGSKDLAGRQTPFCTVVTDLGSAHPTWFSPGVDKCFVPSDALYQAAKDRKLDDDQIVQYGLPIFQFGFIKSGKINTLTLHINTYKPLQQTLTSSSIMHLLAPIMSVSYAD